jgi:hypothetical protein
MFSTYSSTYVVEESPFYAHCAIGTTALHTVQPSDKMQKLLVVLMTKLGYVSSMKIKQT